MNIRNISITIIKVFVLGFIITGCNTDNYTNIPSLGRLPLIEPEINGITIPKNIAPMNFFIREKGKSFNIRITASNRLVFELKSLNGKVKFPIRPWRKILASHQGGKIEIEVISKTEDGKFNKYDPIVFNISKEPVDPYLCYRLLYPGYELWSDLKIVQRSTESFKEKSIIENQLLNNNCINCHSFSQNDPNKFLLHVRGSLGGTYFINRSKVTRITLQTKNMPANAVYPSWHPKGNLVVFSSNKTVQAFHMRPEENIEVMDLFSSLIIYDLSKNQVSPIEERDTLKYMETFPSWSPEGDFLYYCRAKQVGETFDYKNVKYDLVRKSFDQVTGTFGNAEMVFNAHEINKSVSFPSISPDGQYLVFTLQDYGTFSIWHKDADLYLLILKNKKVTRLNLNSNESESYHSWSSNGKWLVFSSKRGDGLTARPYFVYFGSPDSIGKPFVLPQKEPTLYSRMLKTFNKPEFVTGKVIASPRDFSRASKKDPVKATWAGKQ